MSRAVTIVLLVLACPGTSPASPRSITIEDGKQTYSLGFKLEILEDKDDRWTLEDVTSPALSSKFVPSDTESPSLGLTKSKVWARFTIENDSSSEHFLLEVAYPLLDRVTLYTPSRSGAGGYAAKKSGDCLPFHLRDVDHRNPVFHLTAPSGASVTYYMHIDTESSVTFPLTLWDPTAFAERETKASFGYGIFYGIFLVMALYNLFIFLSIRARSYLYLVLTIVSFGLFQFALDGFTFQYLWPWSPWFNNKAIAILGNAFMALMVTFTVDFLSTREYTPVLHKIISGIKWISIAFILLSFFLSYSVTVRQEVVTALLGSILIVVTGFRAWSKGNVAARYFMAAWSVFFLAAAIFSAMVGGLLPHNFFTMNAMRFGSGLGVLLLSISLADRINILKREKETAQADALETQRQAAENLEREVEHKTLDLQQTTQEAVAAKEELAKAYNRLAEHDRLKSRFFANVSHELRTPLTLILTPLERLLATDLSQDPGATRQQLRTMTGNAHRLLRLVNQLLDFSRLESGAEQLAYELWDIRELVEPMVKGFLPFARSKELKLELRAPDELPRAYVDPEKLDKVLSNLLSNACKFTEPGGTVLARITGDDRTLRIAIKDTGIGITEENLARIFERFRQIDDSASRRYEGSGIGLALSKELVDLMGGELEVESDPGVGSTFTVLLPLGKEHIQDPSLIREEASEVDGLARARAAATAMTAEIGMREPAAARDAVDERPDLPLLLVVEDNPDMRALVAEICHEDFCIMEAENGRVGLEAIREYRPALVILDVMMPEMDGHEVLRQVRADPEIEATPVILLTAKAGPEMKLEGLERGADDYLAKPFQSRELLARARNLVRLQRQAQELRTLNTRLQQEVVEQATALERSRALHRYLPPEVVRSIIEEGASAQVGQQLRRLTCFRLELRGFSRMVEKAESVIAPEDMATMLNGYLSEMMEVAFAHGATVDKFVRDMVVGFFGAPGSEGAEHDAVRCALMAKEMWQRSVDLCQRWKGLVDLPPPAPTLVLASGHATVGNFGSSTRMEYTAMGGPVDETASLLPAVETGTVACGQSTWVLIQKQKQFPGELSGEVTSSGRTRPVKLYRLAGPPPELAEQLDGEETLDEPLKAVVDRARRRRQGIISAGAMIADRYEVVQQLGEGGMGRVYQARDLKLETDVALKLLRHDLSQDDSRRARLYREVKLARLVSHHNVARIYDLQEWDGHEFISMEYICGETLGQRLETGPLTLAEGREVLHQLCAGLSAAHAVNIVHRDLKPSNIMLERDGRVAILDFGIARWLHQTGSETRGVVGSPSYMAPEQFADSTVDQRADIYALGVVAFEIFTGERPFQAEHAMGLAYKHTHEPPPDPTTVKSDLPKRLVAVILRCLEKQPSHRFESVAEMASLMEQVRPTAQA